MACCKLSWVFINDLTSGSSVMQTCGETDPFFKALVELSRHYFLSPLAHFWTISLSVLASVLPFRRIGFRNTGRVGSSQFNLNQL